MPLIETTHYKARGQNIMNKKQYVKSKFRYDESRRFILVAGRYVPRNCWMIPITTWFLIHRFAKMLLELKPLRNVLTGTVKFIMHSPHYYEKSNRDEAFPICMHFKECEKENMNEFWIVCIDIPLISEDSMVYHKCIQCYPFSYMYVF